MGVNGLVTLLHEKDNIRKKRVMNVKCPHKENQNIEDYHSDSDCDTEKANFVAIMASHSNVGQNSTRGIRGIQADEDTSDNKYSLYETYDQLVFEHLNLSKANKNDYITT